MEAGRRANLQLEVAVQATPLPVLAGPMSQGDRSACLAGDIGQPTQVATRTLGSEGAPDSAACRGVGCKASTAAGENR